MTRRDLSGIFIFEKFPGEEKKSPTCFEDCQESTQDEFMNSLEKEGLMRLAKHLAKTLKEIGDKMDLVRKPSD